MTYAQASSMPMAAKSFLAEPSSRRIADTAETQGIEKRLNDKNDSAIHGAPSEPSAKKPNGPESERMFSPAMTAREETTCSFAISPCRAETVLVLT